MSELKQKAASGFAFVAVYSAAVRIIQFLGFAVFLQFLQPEDIGACALGMILVTGLVMFREMGFTPALMQINDEVERAFRSAIGLVPVMGWMVFAAIYLLAPPFGKFIGDPSIIPIVQFLGLIAPFSAFGVVPAAYIQRNMQFQRKIIPEIASVLIAYTIGIILAFKGFGAWSYAAALVLNEFLKGIIYWFTGGLAFQPRIDPKMWWRLVKFGYNVSIGSVSGFLFTFIDQFIIGKFFGTAQVGFYSAAMKVNNMLPSSLVILSNQVMLALLSSLQDDKEAFFRAYKKGLTLFALIAVPAASGIFFFGGDLLHLLYGDKWNGAIAALKILAFYGLARSVGEINGEVFFSKAKPGYFKFQGLGRVIAVAALLPLVLKFGNIESIAALFTAVLLITVLITFYLAAKLMEKSIFRILSVFLPHLAGIAAGCLSMFIFNLLIDHLFLNIFVFVAGYALAFFVFAKNEIMQLKDVILSLIADKRTPGV